MSNESERQLQEAKLEALLLSRLSGDADLEFDIEDVRAELAKRLKKHNTGNEDRSAVK